MPSGEAQEPLKQNTPLSMGTPSFIPNQEGVTNPQQREIRDRDSEVAPGGKRGGAARVLGKTPHPCNPLGWRVRQRRASHRSFRGVLDLHPSIPHPGQGSLKGEPPIFIIPAPEIPVPCALQPQRHGSRVAARAPSEAPSPLPCPASPLPSSSPAAVLAALRPARGSDWSNSLSLPRKRRVQRRSLGRPGEGGGTHPLPTTPLSQRSLQPGQWPRLLAQPPSRRSHTNTLRMHPVNSVPHTRVPTL